MDELIKLLSFIIPILVIQLGLQAYSIVNLVKRRRVRFDNKFIWGIIILAGGVIGSIIYIVLRGDDE